MARPASPASSSTCRRPGPTRCCRCSTAGPGSCGRPAPEARVLVSAIRSPARFGRIKAPDETWLAQAPPEAILDPELPIIDTHPHLWERSDHRYLLHEFLADVRTGHNVVATVFMECRAMYRADGPEAMRPVGETEFVAGIAAMSGSGAGGPTPGAPGVLGCGAPTP